MSEDASTMGWHVISGSLLLESLRRVEHGEGGGLVFAELWANASHEQVEGDWNARLREKIRQARELVHERLRELGESSALTSQEQFEHDTLRTYSDASAWMIDWLDGVPQEKP